MTQETPVKPFLNDLFPGEKIPELPTQPQPPQSQPQQKPFIQDLFPPQHLMTGAALEGPMFDAFFTSDQVSPSTSEYLTNQLSSAEVLDAFDRGFKQKWGTEPLGLQGELKKVLRPEEYEGPLAKVLQAFHYSVVRPLAIGIDFASRSLAATAAGLEETQIPGVTHAGSTAQALLEAFPAGHLIGGPTITPLGISGLTRTIKKGKDLGVTDERPPGITPQDTIPTQDTRLGRNPDEAATNRVIAPPIEEPRRDVHAVAREVDPETMHSYDSLQQQYAEYSIRLNEQTEARANDPRVEAAQTEINTILGKVNNVESRLTKRAAARLEDIRGGLQEFLRTDTPEMAETRLARQKVEEAQRDLAPDITKAYQEARKRMPPEEAPTAVKNEVSSQTPSPSEEVRTPVTELKLGDTIFDADGNAVTISSIGRDADKTVVQTREGKSLEFKNDEAVTKQPAPETESTPAPITANPDGGFDVQTEKAGILHAATREQAEQISQQYSTLTQRRPTILQTVTNQLVRAGRSLVEARASAAIVSSYYRTRAARFNGALGTARDLFDREQPAITGKEVYITPRGRERPEVGGVYNVADNTIEIFKSANAGTGIHEFAHTWFEQLLEDAKHPAASDELKADVDAIKTWLKMAEDRPTRGQHEQFARGFERYLMEGTAPTPQLASVFAKFRQWLTDLYRTVAELRAPINDSMRGVYDRLLSKAPEETIIAPERELGEDFAAVHEAEATSTPAGKELEAANQIRGERDDVAQLLTPEINSERRRVRDSGPTVETGPTTPGGDGTTSAEGGRVLPTTVEGTGVEPGGEGARGATVEIVPSGDKFKATGETPTGPHDGFTTESRLVDKDGKPILQNIESPDDVDAAIFQAAEASGQRGQATDGQLIDLADSTGIPASQFPRSIAFDAGQIDALAKLSVDAANDVYNKMVQVANGGDPLELAIAIARLEMIQGKAVNAAGQWGKAGVALRAFKQSTGGPAVDALNSLLKQHTGRSYDQLMQLARQHGALTTPAQVASAINQSHNKFVRAVVYTVTNAFLSNPFTHTVYFAGNMLRNVLHGVEAGAEGFAGALRSAGNDALGINFAGQDRVYMREGGAALYGLGRGFTSAGRPALESFRAGQQQPLPGQKGFTSPWSGAYASPFPESVNNVVGFPGKSVAGIHQFSRVIFYEQHVQRLATRTAIDEGLNGDAYVKRVNDLTSNPPEAMMREAADLADTDMFQRHGGFLSLTRAIEGWTDKYALAKIAFPFVKIGMEITRETIVKRTPFGLLSRDVRESLMGQRGGVAFDSAAGKQMVGLSLLMGGVGLAMSGEVTGAGPQEPGARATWLLTHQPFSVRIGNLWVPYKGLGPQAKVMEMAVDVAETYEHWSKDGKDGEQLAGMIMKGLAKTMLDESFFRSNVQLNEAIADPAHKGAQYLENVASGLLPFSSAVGSTNRMFIDPYQKEIEPGYAGFMDALRSRIPVLSWNVRNKVDMFGNDITSRSINVERYANDPTAQWLSKLGTGPGRLDRAISGVRLTEDQFNDLERYAGTLTKQLLDQARPSLQDQPKGIQIKEINRIVAIARSEARMTIKMESMGTSNDIIEKANELKLKQLE